MTNAPMCSAAHPLICSMHKKLRADIKSGETSRPINGLPRLVIGSKPIDGGYLIFSDEERTELIATYPEATVNRCQGRIFA